MEEDEDLIPQYPFPDDIDYSVLTMHWRSLAMIEDDVHLGMQGMNIGIVDQSVTHWEYALLREYHEIEKTPLDTAMQLSAFSQMWTMSTYEVMRIWRDRVYKFRKWHKSGGIGTAIKNLDSGDFLNLQKDVLRRKLKKYEEDEEFRDRSEKEWEIFEPTFRLVEMLRMNLAKHSAPGKDSVLNPAPGYARIDMMCGSMNFTVVDRDNNMSFLSRRDLAEALRYSFKQKDGEQGASHNAGKPAS